MDVHISTEINAPAEKVWKILAHQFGDIAEWTPVVKSSRAITAEQIPPGLTAAASAPVPARETASPAGTFTEVVTMYSEDSMEFQFDAAGLPPIFSEAIDVQRVIPKGDDQCTVTFDITMTPRGPFKLFNPILKKRFGSTMSRVQQHLKVFAETDQAVSN